jgi:hypothetical protein
MAGWMVVEWAEILVVWKVFWMVELKVVSLVDVMVD